MVTLNLADANNLSGRESNVIQSIKNVIEAFDLNYITASYPTVKERNENADLQSMRKGSVLLAMLKKCVNTLVNILYPCNPNQLLVELANSIQKTNDNVDNDSSLELIDNMIIIIHALPRNNNQRNVLLAFLCHHFQLKNLKELFKKQGYKISASLFHKSRARYKQLLQGNPLQGTKRSIQNFLESNVQIAVDFILSPDQIQLLS